MTITPTSQKERIISLDILRGFAVLGILIMNIQSFSMIGAAYINPYAHGDISETNKIVWLLSHIFASSKFISIFSILFGAGMILFIEKLKSKGINSISLHFRRTLWLLIFGLAHAYLLWHGDILVAYAVCALFIVWFRNKKPRTLFIIGACFIAVSLLSNFMTGISIPYMDEATRTGLLQSWQPTSEMISHEINAYRGSFITQIPTRFFAALKMQTFLFIFYIGWEVAGIMLIGMGLYKLDILSGKKSNRFYSALCITGLTIGLLLTTTGFYQNTQHNFSYDYSFFLGSQYNRIGSICMSIGYIGVVMLLINNFKKNWISRGLQAMGQTALSNYLIQSIICSFIFYGHGLGLYEKVELWQQVFFVLGIWIIQLIVSPIWLRYFHFGPFEWIWRSLTYWKIQKFKKDITPSEDNQFKKQFA